MTRLSAIGQVAMTVEDVGRAVPFYRDVLGLRFRFEAPPALAFFDCDGVRLMLSRPEGTDPAKRSSILVGRGVTFERPPHLIAKLPDHELWMAFFNDGQGNTLALMHERR
jgi:methylmalonyl-CoA/ethylmalonyl-CoA epimerase